MSTIHPEALADRLRDGDPEFLLLDIRAADEFEAWHLPGSENVPTYDALREDPDTVREAFRDLPQDREIVTVCVAGVVSAVATDLLVDMGFDARTLEGGLRAWGRVHLTAPVPVDLPGTLLQVARPGTGCLSYVLVSAGEAAVIDPSQYIGEYEELVEEHAATLVAVLETHAHADHVSGARRLAARHDVPYYLHPADAGTLEETTPLTDAETLSVGDVTVEYLHTPGHTPGSVTFAIDDAALLTGDTLFLESVGRPDLEGGTEADRRRRAGALFDSLQRLLDRPADIHIAPAHDPGSPEPPVTAPLRSVRARNEALSFERQPFIDWLATRIPEPPPNHVRIKRVNVGEDSVDDEEARRLELGPNRCAAE